MSFRLSAWPWIVSFAFFCCSCGRESAIDDFVGTWESPSFIEMFEEALVDDVIPAVRLGKVPEFNEMKEKDPEGFAEFIQRSDEEIRIALLPRFQMPGGDFRHRITITRDSRFKQGAVLNWKKVAFQDREVEFVRDRRFPRLP